MILACISIMPSHTDQKSSSSNTASPALTNKQAKQMFILYCETGDLNQMRRLVALYPNCFSNMGVFLACIENHISVLEYVSSIYRDRIDIIADRNQTLTTCCVCGYDRIVEFLLTNWRDEIGSIIYEDGNVIGDARNYDRKCLALILKHYPDLLDTHAYSRSLDLIIFACKNGWADVVELASPSYKQALIEAEIGSIDKPLEKICKQRWTSILRYILTDITRTDLRRHLVRLSMEISIDNNYYDVAEMLVETHMADIQYEPISMICKDCCMGSVLTPEAVNQRHAFVDRIISTIKHTFEPDVWLCILRSACTYGCPHLLNRFSTDLSYAISVDTYEHLIREVVEYDEHTGKCAVSSINQPALTLYIKLFSNYISTPIIQAIFERAYVSTALSSQNVIERCQLRSLLPGLLAHTGPRLDLGLNAHRALSLGIRYGKPDEIMMIMITFRDVMPPRAIATAVRNTWNSCWDWDTAKRLITYCGQTEDAPEIITHALGLIREDIDQWKSHWNTYLYSSLIPSAKKRVSYMLNYYFEYIDLTLMRILFSMPSSTLYELLDADGIKILIDDHKSEEGCDEVIKLLDPNHENTTYVLLDYGKGVKAAGFE